jgi:hypothetical protein
MLGSEYGILFEEWWCGDEECDCTQMQIDRITANPRFRGAVYREAMWRGEFHTDGERFDECDVKDALAAIKEHGAWVPANSYFRERCRKYGLPEPPIHPMEGSTA